jgi:uncharacterized iron-regulated membrane protein
MPFRSFVLWTHRWIGLVSAVVIVIAGLTGAVVVLPLPPALMDTMIMWHMDLAAGTVGKWTVIVATFASVLLQLGGLYLWWPPKALRVRTDRGWWRLSYDLHNWVGVVGLLMMGLLAVTALGRVFFHYVSVPLAIEMVPRVVSRLHTAFGFPWPLQVVYALGSLAFVAQAVTGALVWWRPSKSGA